MTITNPLVKLLVLNFLIWKLMMEGVLYFKDFHGPIKGDIAKPSNMPNKKWEKMHRKTIGVLDHVLMLVFFIMYLKRLVQILFRKNWIVSTRERRLKIKFLQLNSL